MREYLLVAQDRRAVEQYTRVSDTEWRVLIVDESAARVHLSSIDIELTFDQIYLGVNFTAGRPGLS